MYSIENKSEESRVIQNNAEKHIPTAQFKDNRSQNETEKGMTAQLEKKENLTGMPYFFDNKVASCLPVQLKANVKITKPMSNKDEDEYIVRILGKGTFGKSFETNKGRVVKYNKPAVKRTLGSASKKDGEIDELDPTEKEYDLLVSMSNSGAPVVRPYGFGIISIDETKDPKEFDKRVPNNQNCFLMEKVDILPDPYKRGKDDLGDVNKIVREEFQIFKNMMSLRKEIMETGFYHGDIKHDNVGYNGDGKLVAIDVGVSDKIIDGKANRMWGEFMCSMGTIFSFWGWQDDVTKSFLLTIKAIESRLGVSEPEPIDNNICPYPFRESYREYRLTEFKDDSRELLERNADNLEKALCEYFLERKAGIINNPV